mmetsp:Transcript_57405/g.151177  ORF Transcript_57405/g.151177 Transcript_57405/m.151177 type:complete len:256 (-) Transcript_57405:10-777(-)
MQLNRPHEIFRIFQSHALTTQNATRLTTSARAALAGAALGSDLVVDRNCSRWPRARWPRALPEALLDIACKRKECVINHGLVLGRCFVERHVKLLCEPLAILSADLPLSTQISLVANENLVDRLRRVLLDILEPFFNVLERLLIGDIVHQQYAHRVTIMRSCDSLETLLSSSVQKLQLDLLVVQLDGTKLEIYADSWSAIHVKRVVGESKEKRAFADTAVSDKHQLNKVIIRRRTLISSHSLSACERTRISRRCS